MKVNCCSILLLQVGFCGFSCMKLYYILFSSKKKDFFVLMIIY